MDLIESEYFVYYHIYNKVKKGWSMIPENVTLIEQFTAILLEDTGCQLLYKDVMISPHEAASASDGLLPLLLYHSVRLGQLALPGLAVWDKLVFKDDEDAILKMSVTEVEEGSVNIPLMGLLLLETVEFLKQHSPAPGVLDFSILAVPAEIEVVHELTKLHGDAIAP